MSLTVAMSLTIISVELTDPRLVALVTELDNYQLPLYPSGSDYSMPLEVMANAVNYPFIALWEDTPIGCACLYLSEKGIAEIKRVYVAPEGRGKNVAFALIQRLEQLVTSLKIEALYLETGVYQEAAINLYKKLGFSQTDAFGDYIYDPLSVYMVKPFHLQQP